MTTATNEKHKKPCGCGGGESSKGGCGCGCGCAKCGKSTKTAHSCEHTCGCQVESCCDLSCAERPNYFCGHLLTDEDLRLEHAYFAEKLKMYHRTLDGKGVVCGLALSCDPNCDGHIRIAEGLAIDECGRDLVVCDPLRYDLIGELKRRGWIVDRPGWNPCEPEKREPDCPDTQCFYICLRYSETKDGFMTPLRGACNDGPAACQPTRIHETVCIELTCEKPVIEPAGLGLSLETIGAEFEEISKSRFGQKMQQSAAQLSQILNGQGDSKACELFCQLQYLFLLFLKDHPPLLRCHLAEEVAALKCMAPVPDPNGQTGGGNVKDVFCELLHLVYVYTMDQVMTALLPKCPKPQPGCGVVLGAAEVKAGRIVRLCNTPRQYVWTLNNAIQLVFQLIAERALYDREASATCCPDYRFQCEQWQRAFAVGRSDLHHWVAAPLSVASDFGNMYSAQFFMGKSDWAPVQAAQHITRDQLAAFRTAYSLHVSKATGDPAIDMAAFLRPLTLRENTEVIADEKADGIVDVQPAPVILNARRFEGLEHEFAAREEAVKELQAKLAERERSFTELQTRFESREQSFKELQGKFEEQGKLQQEHAALLEKLKPLLNQKPPK